MNCVKEGNMNRNEEKGRIEREKGRQRSESESVRNTLFPKSYLPQANHTQSAPPSPLRKVPLSTCLSRGDAPR